MSDAAPEIEDYISDQKSCGYDDCNN